LRGLNYILQNSWGVGGRCNGDLPPGGHAVSCDAGVMSTLSARPAHARNLSRKAEPEPWPCCSSLVVRSVLGGSTPEYSGLWYGACVQADLAKPRPTQTQTPVDYLPCSFVANLGRDPPSLAKPRSSAPFAPLHSSGRKASRRHIRGDSARHAPITRFAHLPLGLTASQPEPRPSGRKTTSPPGKWDMDCLDCNSYPPTPRFARRRPPSDLVRDTDCDLSQSG